MYIYKVELLFNVRTNSPLNKGEKNRSKICLMEEVRYNPILYGTPLIVNCIIIVMY